MTGCVIVSWLMIYTFLGLQVTIHSHDVFLSWRWMAGVFGFLPLRGGVRSPLGFPLHWKMQVPGEFPQSHRHPSPFHCRGQCFQRAHAISPDHVDVSQCSGLHASCLAMKLDPPRYLSHRVNEWGLVILKSSLKGPLEFLDMESFGSICPHKTLEIVAGCPNWI